MDYGYLQKIQLFRVAALQQGIPQKVVDDYIKQIQPSLEAKAKASDPEEIYADLKATRGIEELGQKKPEDQLLEEARSMGQIGGYDTSKPLVPQIFSKYASKIEPDEILRLYNSSGSPYGPANESPELLAQLKVNVEKFGYPSTKETAEQKNRKGLLAPADAAIDEVEKLNLSKLGPQNYFSKFSIDKLGGLGVDQNTVSLNQSFELLKQNVVRAMQGARMSDKDIELAANYIPSIIDTPATVKTKLKNLKAFIKSISGQTTTGQGMNDTRPPLTDFITP